MVIRGGTALTTCKTPGCSSSGNARVVRAFDLNQVRVLRELSYGLAARGVFVSHLPLGRARAGPARTGLPAGPGSRRPLYKSALGALPWRAFCSSAGHYCSTWVVLQVHESQTGRLPCRLSSGRQPVPAATRTDGAATRSRLRVLPSGAGCVQSSPRCALQSAA
jgi:hypothetical protein